jgi:aminoglycoside phosphotransferase (APT) family kinase protein
VTLKFAIPEHVVDHAGLQAAVSPRAMLEAFQRYLPPRDRTTWAGCEIENVRYRPNNSCRILYRLWKDDAPDAAAPPSFCYAEFLPPGRSLRTFLELRRRGGPGAPSGFVAELNMVYWTFPRDPRLHQLPAVFQEGKWSVVSYVPRMSCVLSGEYAGTKSIVKLYHDDRVDRVGRVIEALHRAGLSVPRVLHTDTLRRLLVLEHIPGVLFWSDPNVHLRRDVMGAMARELARLHDTCLPDDAASLLEPVPYVARERERFDETARELAGVFPNLADRLERLGHMLKPPADEVTPVLLHGDFHPGQFLIHHGTPRLIDFDTVTRGDPMYDLARFASHLYYKGLVTGLDAREVEKAVSAFRSAYIAAAAPHFTAQRWFWYLSVSLVAKRAHRVLTRLEANAEEYVTRLLTLAEQNAVSIVG